MPVVSYDGQSFIVDGHRVWPVGGSIHYARVPPGQWRDRIRAAAQAGLNCIETAALWALHEPEPGVFRFNHHADLRRFIELIQEEGLWCVLRIGPFVGDGWDMGGLPPWLLRPDGRPATSGAAEPPTRMQLRQASPPFLQAVARYLDAVMGRIQDLQATSSGGGPVLAVQNEHLWLCHNEEQAEEYLGQITRYLRESGCTVPILTRNNLWQEVSGAMETWHGSRDPLSTGRQLHVIQSTAPPIIHIPATETPAVWGRPAPAPPEPQTLLRRLAEAVAGGALFNIDGFCGGMNLGFSAGRLADIPDGFLAASYGQHAPVSASGRRGEGYALVKRLAMFLRNFGDVVSHLRPEDHHSVAATGLSVVHRGGSQGSVVFLLRDRSGPADTEIITPDGRVVPVHMGDESVAWLMLDANLEGLARLDITNLRPWALIRGKMLVLYGPPGSQGIVSIDGRLTTLTVPTGDRPLLVPHDHLNVAVVNTHQVDTAYIGHAGLYLGIGGFDAGGEPIADEEHEVYTLVALDGSIGRRRIESPRRPPAPKLGAWTSAGVDDYTGGVSARFATLAGPCSLEECGAAHGYGWYSVTVKRSRPRKVNLLIPQAADRVHLYLRGRLKTVLGRGPGAWPGHKPLPLTLPAGRTNLVFLADNLGRYCEGLGIAQPKGLAGHLLDVKPLKMRRPKVTHEPRIDPFQLSGYVPRCSVESRGAYPRFTFELSLPRAATIVVGLRGPRPRCVVLINGQPVAIDEAQGDDFLQPFDTPLRKGTNRLTFALLDPPAEGEDYDPLKRLTVMQVVENISLGAAWHYARWRMAETVAFGPRRGGAGGPAFFRATFTVRRADRPLWLHIAGATKGQLYLNDHNLGRYWVATASGQKVPPQDRYYLPEPWLHTERPNELIVFDEHGKSPSRSILAYE
jgi:hypothetical protein